MNNLSEDIAEGRAGYIKETIKRYNDIVESSAPFSLKDEAMGRAYLQKPPNISDLPPRKAI